MVEGRVNVVKFACIWKTRNEKLFCSKQVCLDKIVELVKRNALNWLNLK